MLDQKSIDHLIRLKEALDREPHVSDSDESDTNITTNRGNKLKRAAEDVHMTKLPAPPLGNHRLKIVEYNGVRRPVLYKRRRRDDNDDDDDENDENDENDDDGDDDDSNPYRGIQLEEILAPLTHPADLPHHKSMARTMTSTTLRTLSTRALDVICQEQKHVVQFMKLMSVFLGDDPSYILADNMHLPDYDMEEGEDAPRRTRQLATQEVDPFFALPQIPYDRDFGINRDAAEETRQLTQIALQRCEEFIRCITSVRMGLLRADRFRGQVYRWSKEMGDQGNDNESEEQSSEE
ncbi:hypothetical protein CJU89_6745 [Yarrowia sp. B02]|nr:hypothetical protein CJU89_6745 [Yarrowia sp. B02]